MTVLVMSAAFVGLVHSLSPGHWLPVVMMTKARRWPVSTAMLGAFVAASGHIILSVALGLLASEVEAKVLMRQESNIERYSGLVLLAFGTIYAWVAYRRHGHCVGHSHHGPEVPKKTKGPFMFLFSVGFSPCVAALPVFAAAALHGSAPLFLSVAAFSVGVLAALMGATALVSLGMWKLDHPILEHYGDVITGVAVALLGVFFFFLE